VATEQPGGVAFNGKPWKIYGKPWKIYGKPWKIYGKPWKIYGKPWKTPDLTGKSYGLHSGKLTSLDSVENLEKWRKNDGLW
jgi:hypothetical protein